MAELKDLVKIEEYLEERWYQPRGLLFCAILIIAITLPTFAKSMSIQWALILVASICGLLVVVWVISRQPPKTRKGKVGFLVAILCTDTQERALLKEDFISPLKKFLMSGKAGKTIDFIEFPQHLDHKFLTDLSQESMERLRVKCRAHFVLYGRVRVRTINGKETHIVELDGIVWHGPVPLQSGTQLKQEFTELLPRRVHIPKENDLISFEFTSEWANIVALYIIGIAAALHGDLDYAEILYQDARQLLRGKDHKHPVYQKLSLRLPTRISELYETRAELAYLAWVKTKNPSMLIGINSALERVDKARQESPKMLTLKAIYTMAQEKNAGSTIKILKKIKTPDDPTWNYNMGFLHCYDKKFKQSIRHYRKATSKNVSSAVIAQIEDFMCWIMESEPNRFHLYYALGFFNWKAKGDFIRAKRDFELFLKYCNASEYNLEQELTLKWLSEINNESTESVAVIG